MADVQFDGLFDDGKDDGALRTIGEVAKALGIKTHVLRYWEQQFSQLEPLKRSGGRRYYRTDDIAVVQRIDQLVNQEGYTLKGAASALKSGGGEAATAPATNSEAPMSKASKPTTAQPAGEAAVPAEAIARLKSIRANLAAALEA